MTAAKRPRSPKGIGGVSQRGDGRWVWQQDFGVDPGTGKRDRVTRERATREEVLAARDEVLAARRRAPKRRVAAAGTLASWLDAWLPTLVPGGRSPNTYAKYETMARVHIVPAIGAIPIAKLTTETVAALLDTLSPATREAARTTLLAAWRAAYQTGLVTEPDLIKRVPLRPPASAQTEGTNGVVDDDDEWLLASIADDADPATGRRGMAADDLAAVLLILETERLRARWLLAIILGLRQSEVVGLVWPDLTVHDDGTGTLRVRRSRIRAHWQHGCPALAPCGLAPSRCPRRQRMSPNKSPKSAAGIRSITISAEMVEILQAWQTTQAAELTTLGPENRRIPWMFTTVAGTPLDHHNDRRAWSRILRTAGVSQPYAIHELRHTAASEAGANPSIDSITLRVMFGWSRAAMADRYTHGRDDRLATAWLGQQDRLLKPKLPSNAPSQGDISED